MLNVPKLSSTQVSSAYPPKTSDPSSPPSPTSPCAGASTKSKPSSAAPKAQEESEDELAGGGEDAIPETQVDDDAGFGEGRNFDSDTQSEYTASEGGTRYKRPNQSRKNKSLNKDGKIKTAARKVTAMASQNFKRLKLRNTGAKGGPAHNSRFRRKK